MEESDASINVSEETAVSIFRVRIKNVTPCSLRNYLPVSMYRPILKHFKERKRKEFFPEVVVGTVDITLKKFPRENHNAQYLSKKLVSRICFEMCELRQTRHAGWQSHLLCIISTACTAARPALFLWSRVPRPRAPTCATSVTTISCSVNTVHYWFTGQPGRCTSSRSRRQPDTI
jgi:hypothetical protein